MAKLEPVSVYLRLRDDGQNPKQNLVEVLSDREIQLKQQHPKRYCFNRVFTSKTTQAAIYRSVVAPLVDKALNGFTSTLLTYGQSDTGKTYTVFGDVSEHTCYGRENSADGVIPRAMVSIFDEMKKLNKNIERTVRVSYVELFNEELVDLLYDNSEPPQPLRILEDPEQKGSMYIQNLSAHTVCDLKEVKQIFEMAEENRHNSSVLENSKNCSHKIFIVNVYTRIVVVPGEEHLKSGKIIFVICAGCENLRKTGKKSRKGNTINQSLVTLTNAVKALEEQNQYVPLSESKLTKILRESFRGRSKMAVIATVSAHRNDVDDTLNTLTFAKGARTIKNPVEMNKVTTKSNIVSTLYAELARLEKDLKALRSSRGFYVNAQNYNSIIEETSKKEKELNEKLNLIHEIEERIKELEIEKQLKEKEMEAVNKSFEITKSRAILHKTEFLKRRVRLEHIRDAVEAVEVAKAPIVEQNEELKSVLEATTTDYKVLQNKMDLAQKKMLHNDSLQRNFCEIVVNTYTDLIKTFQEQNDDTYENLTKHCFNNVDITKLLSAESCKVAEETKALLCELQNALKSNAFDDMKNSLIESFNTFDVEVRQCFDLLNIEKQQLEEQIMLLRNKLKENAEVQKKFKTTQLKSTDLLQNVNDEVVQSFDLQTAILRNFSEKIKTIQEDSRPKNHLYIELTQALQTISELNKKEETIQNKISSVSEDIQKFSSDRLMTISEDAAMLTESSKSIHLCMEMLEKENHKTPLTGFENVFNFEELQKNILALEECLVEDTCNLEKFSDKEKICDDIVNSLQMLLQNESQISAHLHENIVSNVEVFLKCLTEQQEKISAKHSKINRVINDATETINTYIKQLETTGVLQSIDNYDLSLSEDNLLEEDNEDLQNSLMIREILDKLCKLK